MNQSIFKDVIETAIQRPDQIKLSTISKLEDLPEAIREALIGLEKQKRLNLTICFVLFNACATQKKVTFLFSRKILEDLFAQAFEIKLTQRKTISGSEFKDFMMWARGNFFLEEIIRGKSDQTKREASLIRLTQKGLVKEIVAAVGEDWVEAEFKRCLEIHGALHGKNQTSKETSTKTSNQTSSVLTEIIEEGINSKRINTYGKSSLKFSEDEGTKNHNEERAEKDSDEIGAIDHQAIVGDFKQERNEEAAEADLDSELSQKEISAKGSYLSDNLWRLQGKEREDAIRWLNSQVRNSPPTEAEDPEVDDLCGVEHGIEPSEAKKRLTEILNLRKTRLAELVELSGFNSNDAEDLVDQEIPITRELIPYL